MSNILCPAPQIYIIAHCLCFVSQYIGNLSVWDFWSNKTNDLQGKIIDVLHFFLILYILNNLSFIVLTVRQALSPNNSVGHH